VNAVAPGYIETEMTRDLPQKAREWIQERIPMGFLGQPEDVAKMVRFLSAPETRYVTGQVFNVDGGMVM
jgi:NAD(P)-dependent dehydrogenase (short-subunit alcohol dehydrogenase family)